MESIINAPIDVEREFAKVNKVVNFDIGGIIEERSEESEEETSEEISVKESEFLHGLDEMPHTQVDHIDYIQAFTHFTYLYTNQQVMVCDLQGVYNSDMVPSVFELTDPAIHYRSKSGERNVFGRTDAGEVGMDLLFKTHRCSQVCRYMKLTRKNKHCKKTWKRH